MEIHQYLDSTYLKTPQQAGISEEETLDKIKELVNEAIDNHFKLVMVRSNHIKLAKQLISKKKSNVLVGTVIGFHTGQITIDEKLLEAQKAIDDGADELDFVVNYQAFINGNSNLVKEEIIKGTQLAIIHNKIIKWIIEVAALTNDEIISISQLLKNTVLTNFGKNNAKNVFIKSSTGFFKTNNNKPNGATFESIQLMLKHASPLPVKAAGGVKSYRDAVKMINLGVLRIGTSSAKQIADGETTQNSY